jgi:hypothetical protein
VQARTASFHMPTAGSFRTRVAKYPIKLPATAQTARQNSKEINASAAAAPVVNSI